MRLPKILLVHTGGTLGMAPIGDPSVLAPGPLLEQILEQVPELNQLADLKLRVAFNQDSATNEPRHIMELARVIRLESFDCDGVLLVHGTDTMAFTASLLGFLLADLGKPVVLTGSQRPLAYLRSDARGNLVDAVTLAASGISDLGICFGDYWIRGVASEKTSVHRYQAFESPNLLPLAELGLSIRFHPHAGQFERNVPSGVGERFESNIKVYAPYPGMQWPALEDGVKGVVIEAYGAGNLPMGRSDLIALLSSCKEKAVPVVILSQCLRGGVDLCTYELGRQAEGLGAISGGTHTRWAAIAKLGLSLGAGDGVDCVRGAFQSAWAGEPIR